MESAIEIRNLYKVYPTFQLKNVNITLPKGYIMGFIGANGRGKSTTISTLLGLRKADSGVCLINGKTMAEMTAEEKCRIGVVLDECNFPENLTYRQIDRFMKKVYKTWDSEKFLSRCISYGLPEKTMVYKYSKGMKMKLSIAAAMCHGAQVLILDEATSGLDPVARDEILEMLLDFVQDEENSVLMSSHITSDMEKVCDYITLIRDGEIVFTEEKDRLMEKYGILHCSNADFAKVDKTAVIGSNSNSFATDALVEREKISVEYVVEKASIEDIMLYYVKEGRK